MMNDKMIKALHVGVVVISVGASAAMAQAIPDAGSLLRQQQRSAPPAPLEELPGVVPPEASRPAMRDASGKRLFVKGFRVVGTAAPFPDAEYADLLKGYSGRELTLAEMQEAAGLVARFYRERGYFLARAYVPKQEITDGVVVIQVVEGRIEGKADGSGIVVKGDGVRLDPNRIRGVVAAAVEPGEPVRQEALERGLLILNDLPGVGVRSGLEPGAEPGATRLTIEASEGPLATAELSADNYGNRYTGRLRANAGAYLNDPLGRGDILSLNATASSNAGMKYVRGAYQTPIGYDGLKLGVSVSRMTYRLGEELTSLQAGGHALTADAALSYPILRSRAANLLAQSTYTHKILYNRANGETTSDKRTDAVALRLAGDRTDNLLTGGVNQAALTLTYGRLDLSAWTIDRDNDAATARAAGAYAKLEYAAGRVQRLADSLNLYLGVSGQFANKNLDSSEKFQLGGAFGLRAYPSGEASGDSGHKLTAELRWSPTVDLGFMPAPQLVGFYDHGWICQVHSKWTGWDASGQPNCYAIKGAGVGLSVYQIGAYEVRAAYAHAIGSNPGRTAAGLNSDGLASRDQFWLQASVWF